MIKPYIKGEEYVSQIIGELLARVTDAMEYLLYTNNSYIGIMNTLFIDFHLMHFKKN